MGWLRLDQDMHVHTTFSDGRHSPESVLEMARERRLTRIGFADHVRRDTDWLASYVAHLEQLEGADIQVVVGVEAKLLDASGTLDVPPDLQGIERILVADHRLPLRGELLSPRQVRESMRSGTLDAPEVWESLLCAYEACAERYSNLQLAHPLSFASRVGIDEASIPTPRLDHFADVMAANDVAVEVSERWRCPGRKTLLRLRLSGVELVASTDAHDARAVGAYDYVRRISA